VWGGVNHHSTGTLGALDQDQTNAGAFLDDRLMLFRQLLANGLAVATPPRFSKASITRGQ
jgi:hypothetical protein